MSKMGLMKGKRGEREVVKILQPIVDRVYEECGLDRPVLKRNTLQSFAGGYDLIGIDWLALEVKFQETLSIDRWWEQTLRQADPKQIPVLFYRQSRKRWKVIIAVNLCIEDHIIASRGEIPLDDFLMYFEMKLKTDLRNSCVDENGEV